MAFGEKCEECGKRPVDYVALHGLSDADQFDYCGKCSKDLCPDCMKHPCYGVLSSGERVADSHTPSEDEPESDEQL